MASRRSIWKGPFVDTFLINSVKRVVSSGKNTIIKTWSRRSTILPAFVGIVFSVYNGKKFIPVLVTEQMIGKKLGEFAPTRTFTGHGANKKAVRV